MSKCYEIVGECGSGYAEFCRYNHRDNKWLCGIESDRHDGSGTTIDSHEEAEAILKSIEPDEDIRNIRIKEIDIDDDNPNWED